MAGDWMKIELELPDKPEVHYIAGVLNIDPDAVVGKLIRIWQWFNKHTENGNAVGVTFALPDRIAGVTGFGEAMQFAGWLIQNGSTLTMPKFDRHTSESAKTRANAASRQNRYRNKSQNSNAGSNGASVTTPSQREEKRRVNNTSRFSDFWAAYPIKKGKAVAEKAWNKAKVDRDFDSVLEALKAQVASCKDLTYFPHASTWINGRRWEDETEADKDRAAMFAGGW